MLIENLTKLMLGIQCVNIGGREFSAVSLSIYNMCRATLIAINAKSAVPCWAPPTCTLPRLCTVVGHLSASCTQQHGQDQ